MAKEFANGAAWLAALFFLYLWITLAPFPDLSQANVALSSDVQSNTLNQILFLAFFAGMMALGLRKDLRPLLLRPFVLIALLIAWVTLATFMGPAGFVGVRRLALATLLICTASVFLLLPRDERQLGTIFTVCASIVLALCYFGVIFLPQRSIHQASDYLEPMLEGDWRGLFDHKNNAAPSMVVLTFIGLYVMRARSRVWGLVIAVLAAFFVFKSGGKTSIVLMPATLVLAWLVERGNLFWRSVIVVGAVGAYTALTVGSVLYPQLTGVVAALGVDTTFTGRTDIWDLAISGIQSNPILGYGYSGFWGTEGVVFGFREDATWAVQAVTAHNSYVDMILVGGFVGLALLLVWVVLLPLRDLSRSIQRNGPTPLTRLFTRIWLYSLIAAGMETMFMSTNGAGWFCMLIAIFGLRLESQAHRRAVQPASAPVDGAGAAPLPA